MTSGKRYWQDGTPVAGQQFEYGFDDIGNRKYTGVGGDASGCNVRGDSYTANRLNQYDLRTVNGVVDQIGIANPTAAVTVNGNTAYRKGEYFDYALPLGNGSAPQYPQVTVVSSYPPGQTNKGNIFVPQTPESFGYDLDGNMTNDGRWNYTWDGENRLIKVESLPNAPAGSKRRSEFTYDHQSRRVKSKVTNLDTGLVTSENKFLYDGWNLLAELNATNNAIIRSYVWGLDVSGSLQGAGGVGGLLKVTYNGPSTTNCFVAYDGNGNVMTLVNAQDGGTLARYEYGPFAEVIRATGPMAKANPIRFSTKYQDGETDLLYYGYRYYSAGVIGRWLSRDPLGEWASKSLFEFSGNNPVNIFDPDGQITVNLTSLEIYNCGGFSADFEFRLQNSPWPDGYIVQEVALYEFSEACDDYSHPHVEYQHFWEAWPIGGSVGPVMATATDNVAAEERPFTNGEGWSRGKIRFFPADFRTVAADIRTWTPGTPHRSSGLVPSTTTPPAWWNLPQSEPEGSREVTWEWKCCCPWLYNHVQTNPK